MPSTVAAAFLMMPVHAPSHNGVADAAPAGLLNPCGGSSFFAAVLLDNFERTAHIICSVGTLHLLTR
jgi:hypothetical protein